MIYSGFGSDDVFDLSTENDLAYGGAGNDVISDVLGDAASSDVMFGGRGNDVMTTFSGRDVMLGGAGKDVFIVQNFTDEVIIDGGRGDDTVYIVGTEADYDAAILRFSNVENVVWI